MKSRKAETVITTAEGAARLMETCRRGCFSHMSSKRPQALDPAYCKLGRFMYVMEMHVLWIVSGQSIHENRIVQIVQRSIPVSPGVITDPKVQSLRLLMQRLTAREVTLGRATADRAG